MISDIAVLIGLLQQIFAEYHIPHGEYGVPTPQRCGAYKEIDGQSQYNSGGWKEANHHRVYVL